MYEIIVKAILPCLVVYNNRRLNCSAKGMELSPHDTSSHEIILVFLRWDVLKLLTPQSSLVGLVLRILSLWKTCPFKT